MTFGNSKTGDLREKKENSSSELVMWEVTKLILDTDKNKAMSPARVGTRF